MPHFLNQNIYQVFWAPLEVWLGAHPLIHWFLIHPFILLGSSLTALLLLAGLISAIAHLTQNLWLRLLQLPVQLIQLLSSAIAIGLQRLLQYLFSRSSFGISDERATTVDLTTDDSRIVISKSALTESGYKRLQVLLARLEQVRQEESDLIEQIKALVEERSP